MGFFKQKMKVDKYDHIIKKLIRIRESNYSISQINQINDPEISELKSLVLFMGNNILKTNYKESKQRSLSDAKDIFSKTIDSFFAPKNKFAIAHFSAQLLQYYTILCNSDFIANTSLQEFLNFLANNSNNFGSVDKNLFVVEYKLIKIYNELCILSDSTKIVSLDDKEAQFNILLEHLNSIRKHVEQWCFDAPQNIFLDYLSFAIHYSSAKALELQFYLKEATLGVDEKILLQTYQKIFLSSAEEDLNKIDSLQELCNEKSHYPFVAGAEFSLGQNILIKLPNANLQELKEHVISLMRN